MTREEHVAEARSTAADAASDYVARGIIDEKQRDFIAALCMRFYFDGRLDKTSEVCSGT
jgi:hypothetical protein